MQGITFFYLKIVLALIFTYAVFSTENPFQLLAALPFLLVLGFLTSRNEFILRIKWTLKISAVIFLINFLIFPTSDLTLKIFYSLKASLRITLSSIIVFTLFNRLSPGIISQSFFFLPHALRTSLIIAFAILPSVIREAENITVIQSVKGYKTNHLNPLKSLAPILIPLTHRAINKSVQLGIVLSIKGYE